ncbi:uncharacterized protein LOC135693783 [Rhopilema esculentum]|uniref:uncharacterized protein LOC135693783 n=1 Tax=Rhopilema esculentum TaxID=499914 RepID=UPI0031D45FA6|eukprot:gene10323-19021_t
MAASILFAVLVIFIHETSGHGRLIDPPSRNAMWRFGFKNPPNYNDNELNCGGFSVHWQKNKGKCGVCGDPAGVKKHEYPGKYANGIIGEVYQEGQQIDVAVDLTSNHQGWFEFRIAKLTGKAVSGDNRGRLVGQLLELVGGGTRYQIPQGSGDEVFKIKLKLPSGLICDQCVMQWWYSAGNNWDCDSTGCGVGKGKQEHFINCADVKIVPKGAPVPEPSVTKKPPVIVTDKPTQERQDCRAVGAWAGSVNMNRWCRQNCAIGRCPSAYCKCDNPV